MNFFEGLLKEVWHKISELRFFSWPSFQAPEYPLRAIVNTYGNSWRYSQLITGVNDTRDKLFTSVNNTCDKLMLGSLPPVNILLVSLTKVIKGAQVWDFRPSFFYINKSYMGRWVEDWRKKIFFSKTTADIRYFVFFTQTEPALKICLRRLSLR